MKYCEKCGTQLTDDAKFCPKCGNPSGNKQADGIGSENSSYYCIELISAGPASLQVVKVIKDALKLSLKDAKDYVDSIPCVIKNGLSLSEANELAQIIETSGAKTNVKQGIKSTLNDSPVQSDSLTSDNNIMQEEVNQNSLTKWDKIALGIAGFIALSGALGCYTAGESFSALICVCCLAYACAFFMGYVKMKYSFSAWVSAIIIIVMVFALIPNTDESKKEEIKKEQTLKKSEDKLSTEAEKEKQEIEKEKKVELNKLLGNYYYSTYIGDTNAQENYTITLNTDGTFDFKPSNEQTKKWMELKTLMDGYEYPDGGKWEYKETVGGKAIFLDFDGSWDGSIALDNMVLEIKNMNGYNLKTKVRH